MRVLHVDATEGASAASLLAALLDLGVAPSPLLAAIAELGLPIELRLEPGRVEQRPAPGEVLVAPTDVEDLLHPLAADAVGRMLVAEARQDALASLVDAGLLATLHAAALAVDALLPEDVTVSWTGPTTPDGAALLETLAGEGGAGAREPPWRGTPARGAAKDRPRTRVLLGEVAPA